MTDQHRPLYLAAAYNAYGNMPLNEVTPKSICEAAADAAVNADRKRMADHLRSRIMYGKSGISDPIAMLLDDTMFRLAEQIEHGMQIEPSGVEGIHPTQYPPID